MSSMPDTSQLVRAQDLEPGCLIEIEAEGYGRSIAKVQRIRDTLLGIEIEIFARKPIEIPAGCAAVNYSMIRVPYDTPVRVSHLPSRIDGDTTRAHAGNGQQQRDP